MRQLPNDKRSGCSAAPATPSRHTHPPAHLPTYLAGHQLLLLTGVQLDALPVQLLCPLPAALQHLTLACGTVAGATRECDLIDSGRQAGGPAGRRAGRQAAHR
jgi:hypothetical protein